jgi:integrase
MNPIRQVRSVSRICPGPVVECGTATPPTLPNQPPSGQVFRVERERGPAWYAKYRLPDGRQVQKRIGPAWSERGRPPAGYYTKRQAEEWLRELLDQARRGKLPGMVRTGTTVAQAAEEYLRYIEHDRGRKPSTVRGYRWVVKAWIAPAFGELRVEDVTSAHVEAWITAFDRKPSTRRRPSCYCTASSNGPRRCTAYRSTQWRTWRSRRRRAAATLRCSARRRCGRWRAPRRASRTERSFLAAAFAGLRMGELIALHWRDVDFAGSLLRVRTSYTGGALTTPKSGKVRSVPLAPDVAQALARLADRELFTAEDDLVFPGETGEYLDGSALRRRYKASLNRAGLRQLRFHDLRHTFGTRMIA